MTLRQWPQMVIALPFLIAGASFVLIPGPVEALLIRPEYQHGSVTTHVLIGACGFQSVLIGLLALFARFRRVTYVLLGLSTIPFLWANYYFAYVLPVFTQWIALDFLSNLAIVAACAWGARQSAP